MKIAYYELKALFLNALRQLPGVSIRSVESEPEVANDRGLSVRPDVLVRIDAHGTPTTLVVEFKTAGYPRDVKPAADQLREYLRVLRDENAQGILVAPILSDESRSILTDADVGYFDSSGSLLLPLRRAFWMVSLPRKPSAERKLVRTLFTGKRTQVLLQLLAHVKKEWHVGELAEASGVALGTAHRVLEELERNMWVRRTGRGPGAVRTVTEPGKILDSWGAAHSLDAYAVDTFFSLTSTPRQLYVRVTRALRAQRIPYVVSFETGAMLTAPHLTSAEQMRVIVPNDGRGPAVLAEEGMEPVADGANVYLFATASATPFMLAQNVGGIEVASNIQLYLDLLASPGRAREQAQFLRKERIGF